jgi:hypothetical protein
MRAGDREVSRPLFFLPPDDRPDPLFFDGPFSIVVSSAPDPEAPHGSNHQ